MPAEPWGTYHFKRPFRVMRRIISLAIFLLPHIYIYIYITAVVVEKQGETHISMHYDELNKKEFSGILT